MKWTAAAATSSIASTLRGAVSRRRHSDHDAREGPSDVIIARLQGAAPDVQMFETRQDSFRHGAERVGGDSRGDACSLANEAIEPPQQRAATAEHQTVMDEVGRQVGAATIDRLLNRIDDRFERLGERIPQFL